MDLSREVLLPLGRIRGGSNVPHCKNTAESASVVMPAPSLVFIPMLQHIGAPCIPTVNIGDKVLVGSLIGDSEKYVSAPIYSSVSGIVKDFGEIVLQNGTKTQTVIIESDGEKTPRPDIGPVEINTAEDLIKAARYCGLVGLGGAGFPTHVKLSPKEGCQLDTLIINGAECEPFITSDYRSCVEDHDDIMEGVYLIKRVMGFSRVIIAVEDNKPQAIEKLAQIAADRRDVDNSVRILKLKSHYPQGAEKVLIYTALKRRMPLGALPADVGCIVMNITSVAELYRYIRTGMPLVSKRITIDGTAIAEPKNVIVPLGASFSDVINFCGGFKSAPVKVLAGGPMMGTAIADLSQPVMKQHNAVLAFDGTEKLFPDPTPCINCGRCHRACPIGVMPSMVEKALKNPSPEAMTGLNVGYCFECGSCAFSCPAKRPLVQVMKLAKIEMRGTKNG